jgi:hypothetical protein
VAGQIKADRSGARVVELFVPFEWLGEKVDAVTLGPIVLGHALAWKQAQFKDLFDMMVEASSINGKPATEEVLRQLRYPDADRVLENFAQVLPPDIRNLFNAGMWPEKVAKEPQPEVMDNATYDGGSEPVSGVPPDPMDIDE